MIQKMPTFHKRRRFYHILKNQIVWLTCYNIFQPKETANMLFFELKLKPSTS